MPSSPACHPALRDARQRRRQHDGGAGQHRRAGRVRRFDHRRRRSSSDTNSRWPDHLARRLAARRGPGVVVLNAGISGNRVLGDGAGVSALARFDEDVLTQTGVTHVVIVEGINDIGIARSNPSPSAADLIAGHKQLIERARVRGLKVLGATLTPFLATTCTPATPVTRRWARR